MPEYKRIFHALRGHDCHDGCAFNDPQCGATGGQFHGIGALRLYFAVTRGGRAVAYELITNLYPRSVHIREVPVEDKPWNLGVLTFHRDSPPPGSPDHAPTTDNCDLLAAPCWTDGQYCAADAGYDILLDGGDQAVYEWLERLLEEREGNE